MIIKTTQQVLDSINHLSIDEQDYYVYFIHLLIERRAFNKGTFFHSANLKRTFGRKDYLAVIKLLRDKGLISRKDNHGAQYTYITYQLLVPNKNIIDFELTNKILIHRIELFYDESEAKLPEFLKQMKFNIDKLILTPRLIEMMKEDNLLDSDSIYLTHHKVFKNRISRAPSGRVFSTVIEMKRIHRMELGHEDGSQLIEIDIKNSQLIGLNHLSNCDINFKNDVITGIIYKKLADYMGISISDKENRDKFKKQLFNSFVMNENKGCVKNSKYGLAIKSLYPCVYYWVLNTKDKNTKAHRLQHLEAELVIDVIYRNLIDKGIFCVTVHDSFIVKEQDKEQVMNEINESALSWFGHTLSINYVKLGEAHPIQSVPIILLKTHTNTHHTQRCITGTLSQGVLHQKNRNFELSEKSQEKYNIGYNVLTSKGINPSIRNLMKETGLSYNTVRKYKKNLVVSK